MIWNDNNTITVVPTAKPKKCTGTRFAAVLGANRWTTPFNAWCAITRTYEEPFEDTIYTVAGKTIEPKQAEFIAKRYFWQDVVSPTDVFGEDYFKRTHGDFFPKNAIFGGMWDYLLQDDGETKAVLEMKTTKRAEDWIEDIPEYYALQAALYAYLLGVDDVIMVCTILEDEDYDRPDLFVCNGKNTFERHFKLSERYPNFDKTIKKVEKWWKDHVETGISPEYGDRDKDIIAELKKNNVNPDTDLALLISEAEELETKLDLIKSTMAEDEKRLKVLKDQIKDMAVSQFREGDKQVIVPGSAYVWTVSKTISVKVDEAQMKKDGILDQYKTKETVTYRLTNKLKEE